MCTLAPNVRKSSDDVARQFVLDVKMPLLHIRPYHLVRNGYEAKWERRSRRSPTDIFVSGNVGLGGNLDDGSGLSFHPFSIGLIPICVLKENAIASADGGFAVSKGIPRKAYTGSRVKKMPAGATNWHTAYPALHESVIRIADDRA